MATNVQPSSLSLQPTQAWHALKAEQVLTSLDTRIQGLSEDQAQKRIADYGPNRLTPASKRGPLMRFLLQFHNTLIYVLLASAVAKLSMQQWVDAGVIIGVVVINAIIGFLQEGKAASALDAIRNMLSETAMVLRDGQREIIPSDQLVPGDIVLLTSGDRVPADARIIESRNLRIDESTLTGESVPVEKSPAVVSDDAVLGDRSCITFSGTIVTYGSATCVITETGDRTQIGRIGKLIGTLDDLSTPLLDKVADLGKKLTYAIIVLAGATLLIGSVWRDHTIKEMFLMAVALAVAAIPEGLPALMTVTLALGVQRMARQNAIVRRLPSVETLGSVTVICSDKTGTLTKNEMTVQSLFTAERKLSVSGVGYAPEGSIYLDGQILLPDDFPEIRSIGQAALLCNDARLFVKDGIWRIEGDPTEGALLSLAMKFGFDIDAERHAMPRADAIPFESEYRFMATMHHDHRGANHIFVKGAPERLLQMCDWQATANGPQELNRSYWEKCTLEAAREGQRTLAIAVSTLDTSHQQLQFTDVDRGLTLLAIVGIIDPPRDEAIAAVAKCHAAGISVKMITGDHAETARAIGQRLGIGLNKPAITGSEIEQMDDEQLRIVVEQIDVYARASPEHKLRLIEALQANGHIAAMTGDGVNDAPALKRADVGLSMGMKGTEAAKEASEVVLADDNFATISRAVEEGRTIYDNLRKSILFLLPTNGAQALVVIAAILLDLTLPLTSVQILWINMATSVTLGIALAFETPEGNVMQRPPRAPDEPLLSAMLVWRILFVSTIITTGSLGLFLWELERGNSLESARTIAVSTIVIAQMFYLLNCRYLYRSVLSIEGIFGNRLVLAAIAGFAVIQLLFIYAPFMQTMFGSTGLDGDEWLRVMLVGLVVLVATEIEKKVQRWRLGV